MPESGSGVSVKARARARVRARARAWAWVRVRVPASVTRMPPATAICSGAAHGRLINGRASSLRLQCVAGELHVEWVAQCVAGVQLLRIHREEVDDGARQLGLAHGECAAVDERHRERA